ncbi:hypothetical protein ASE78_16950 [Sphingomonas sp. Leaf25]|nr:hypothetical protein ASE78_16950 [Sphingomonas sp. Leaf25]
MRALCRVSTASGAQVRAAAGAAAMARIMPVKAHRIIATLPLSAGVAAIRRQDYAQIARGDRPAAGAVDRPAAGRKIYAGRPR